MPSFALIAASPSLLSAALAAAAPEVPPRIVFDPAALSVAVAQQVAGQQAPAQDAAPPPPDVADKAEAPLNEIVVEGEYGPPKSDPLESVNEDSYRITQAVDTAVIEPVAYAYRDGLPEPIRDGLGNVVRNLGEPSNALNFLLQGKVGKAFKTLGRMAINTTVGVGGLFDVAKKPGIGLAYRRNGFANTLGYYGVGPGAYLYLPVTGATTVRDLIGSTLDQALLPFAVGKPFNKPAYAATYFVVNGLDQRLAFDEELARIEASDDPYLMRRQTYLAQRRRDIAALKGEVIPEDEDEYADETPSDAAPPTAAQADAAVEPLGGAEAVVITQPR